MAKQQKFYVVWRGHQPGVYDSWSECEAQVKGFEGAMYKAFSSLSQAQEAAADSPWEHIGNKSTKPSSATPITPAPSLAHIEHEAIAVDAACSGNPGMMEYRGVYLRTGKEIFHFGPIWGTNNIGEFLAIVHALALLEQKGLKMTIYSDSRNAINWVRRKQCKTQLAVDARSRQVHETIARAEAWLKSHRVTCPILKWETQDWGEIPADFGRK
ncbi:MAG: ribonuclease H family protein [Bacteroidales bacterium]|nr:ribonuclease H family protein [Bacteroidales bacterium]